MADSEFSEEGLEALIANEIRQAQKWYDEELTGKRAKAIEYLSGVMNDTPARPNGSTVTSRDVSDTISWMLPGIMRVFMSSDNMAEFEPSATDADKGIEKAEELSKQASDYLSHAFMKENPGYRNVYNTTHNALTLGDGVIKHWWDDQPETEISNHSHLTIEQVAEFVEDDEVEILTQEANAEPDMLATETGEEIPVETYNIKIKRVTQRGRLRILAIDPGDFLVDDATETIENNRFSAHRERNVTRSDLVERGFDRNKVDELSADGTTSDDSDEGFSRRNGSDETQAFTRSMERVDLYECYIKVDVDNDGIAETIRVYYAGDAGAGKVLEWDVFEDGVPFSIVPCYPKPHNLSSESVADRTMDIQQIKTVLHRQALDNLYAANLPMREVEAGSVLNPDILVSPKFGGILWKKKGSGPTLPHSVPFVADKAFAAAEYFDRVSEKRTGVSQSMMGLDPEALQNQSATANQNAKDAAYSQNELVARNMAELGWHRVFSECLKLTVKHQDRPKTILLRGKFVEMDPRHWNANMGVTVNVGLGTGSKDRDMAMLNQVLAQQFGILDRLLNSGLFDKAVEMIPKIVKTLVRIAESAGLRNPDEYYVQFDEQDLQAIKQKFEQAASKPDPQMEMKKLEVEVQAQAEQLKIEAAKQTEQIKAQGNQVKEQAQLDADLQVKEAERQDTIAIKAMEHDLEREKMAQDAQLKREDIAARIYIADMKGRTDDGQGNTGEAPQGGGSQEPVEQPSAG